MAEKYIINMPLKTTPSDTDLMIIEDAQDTKRMTWANVVKPIEDLVDNTVAAHEAESASKHITESGSNANGEYMRFDDGTMICKIRDLKLEYFSTRQLRATWTPPASLINTTGLVVISNLNQTGLVYAGNIEELTSISFVIASATAIFVQLNRLVGQTNFQSGDQANVFVFLIGRWK